MNEILIQIVTENLKHQLKNKTTFCRVNGTEKVVNIPKTLAFKTRNENLKFKMENSSDFRFLWYEKYIIGVPTEWVLASGLGCECYGAP